MADVIILTIDPASIPNDGTTEATVTATLTTDGTAPDTTPTPLDFTISPAVGCTLSASSVTTDAATGVASITVTGIRPADYTITVTSSSEAAVTANVSLTIVQDRTITLEPENLISNQGTPLPLKATVLDSSGNGIDAVTVNWSVDEGALYITTDQTSSQTGEDGVASANAICTLQGVEGVITAKLDTFTTASCNVFFSSPTVPPVSILNADDHYLDASEIALGVELYIPDPGKGPYTGGDFITLYWGEAGKVVDSKQFPIDASTQFPIPVDISKAFNPSCLYDGDYSVFYVFEDRNQNTHCSQNFPLTVSGVEPPPSVEAPTFPEASNNIINANAAAGGTPMRISYSGMAEGDSVTIFWQEYSSTGEAISRSAFTTTFTVNAQDVAFRFHEEFIPQDKIIPVLTRGTGQGFYNVILASDGSTVVSATATVDVILN